MVSKIRGLVGLGNHSGVMGFKDKLFSKSTYFRSPMEIYIREKFVEIGGFDKSLFFDIIKWKSQRSSTRIENQNPALSQKINGLNSMTTEYLDKRLGEEQFVWKMANYYYKNIKFVGMPILSAFLMFIDPEEFTILDVRVWQTLKLLGGKQTKQYYGSLRGKEKERTVKEYLEYNNYCKKLMKEFNCNSLRELDGLLWSFHESDGFFGKGKIKETL